MSKTVNAAINSAAPCPNIIFRHLLRNRDLNPKAPIVLCYLSINNIDISKSGENLIEGNSPERRCSSHTFRYGYLVTT